MSVYQAFILGLVQGVTEFLPISSSGFLILVPEFFGWEVQSLAFDAFVHLATLAAVIFALWSDVTEIVKERSHKLLTWIILATIPVLFFGFILQEVIEYEFRSGQVVAWSFIVWGVVLYLVDRFAKQKTKKMQSIGLKRSLAIGFAQVIALIPGTSRSGITITAGLAAGMSREAATRFSFLLGIPTIAAAGLFKLMQVFRGATSLELLPAVVGTLTAFFTAFITIKFLLSFLKQHSFAELAIFRVIIGVVILLL